MESQSHTQPLFVRDAGTVARCPFHDGPLTLDLLLAELGPEDEAALDLALDLRSLIKEHQDARSCVRLALRLRQALDGGHYLAFYRVRRWLQRTILVQVRGYRGDAWRTYPLPLNSARLGEIENACLAAWASESACPHPDWAQVRFVFRATPAQSAAPAPLSTLA